MRDLLKGLESDGQARQALEEIERLVRDTEAAGLRLDPWLGELATELRAVLPEIDAPGAAKIAKRIAADPRASFAAQGRVRSDTIRLLRG